MTWTPVINGKLMRWNTRTRTRTRTRTQLKHVCTLWAICNFDIELCLGCNKKVWPAGGAIKASIGLQLHPPLSPVTHNPLCFLSAQTGSWRWFDWLYSTSRWWWRHGSTLSESRWCHPVTSWCDSTAGSSPLPYGPSLLSRSSLPVFPFRLRLTAACVFRVIHMFWPAAGAEVHQSFTRIKELTVTRSAHEPGQSDSEVNRQ